MYSEKKRYLRLFVLLIVLLAATSASPAGAYICNPPPGFCYSYCVRPYPGNPFCMDVGYGSFCAYISGGCYGTNYCDDCTG